MLQTSAIQVLTAADDRSTYYVGMQPVLAGRQTALYVAPELTFKPYDGTLTTTGNLIALGLEINTSITVGSTLSVVGNVTAGNILATGFFYANGTVFSGGGGGGGTPGGTSGQVQYNNGGSFDGATGFTINSSNVSAIALTINTSATIGTTLGVTGNVVAANVIVGTTTTGAVTANTVTFLGTAANVISMIFNSGNVSIDFVLG